ncbi:MAG: hypothetical protein LCH38_08830 [Proteobacteria bacterium]|nr:hypothetical protein [Pseudomonadota bacterium]
MISEPVLRLAVARAIVTADQAERLRQLASEHAVREFEVAPDHEKLRFITGFGDIFVVIGLGLFLGAAGYFLADNMPPLLLWGGLAVLSWGLAELFTRHRRMALPSIVLLVLFSGFSFLALHLLLTGLFGKGWPEHSVLPDFGHAGILGTTALANCALVALHYWRFRVPVTVASGVGALALAAFAFLLALAPGFMTRFGGWVILAFGIGVFALAMRFDRSDLARETRRTDIAFWLHLMAAPLIVHSFIAVVFGGVHDVTFAKAIGLLAVFAGLAVLALLIDRRAILVSALVYAGTAFGTVFRETALSNAAVPASLLVLGVFILGLSSGWQPLRRGVLALVPAHIRAGLPTLSNRSNA